MFQRVRSRFEFCRHPTGRDTSTHKLARGVEIENRNDITIFENAGNVGHQYEIVSANRAGQRCSGIIAVHIQPCSGAVMNLTNSQAASALADFA